MEQVLLYNEGTAETLDIGGLSEYLKEKLGKVQVKVRGSPFTSCLEKSQDYATKLASIKIQDVHKQWKRLFSRAVISIEGCYTDLDKLIDILRNITKR